MKGMVMEFRPKKRSVRGLLSRRAGAAAALAGSVALGLVGGVGCSTGSSRDEAAETRVASGDVDRSRANARAEETGEILIDGLTPAEWAEASRRRELAYAGATSAGGPSAAVPGWGRVESGVLYGGGQDAIGGGRGGSDDVFRDMQLDRDAGRAEAEQLIEQAGAARLSGELRRAEGLLERALELDPANEAAELDLAEVQQLLGEGTIRGVSGDFFQREKLAREMTRAEIRRSINLGLLHEEQEEFDRAIQLYKSALDMARNEPFDLQLDEEISRTKVYLERAEQARKRQEAEEYQAALEKAEAVAREDLENSLDYIENQIKELRRRAELAVKNESYRRAVGLYEQILELNPRDEDARRAGDIAREQAYIHEKDRLIRRSIENYEKAVIDVEKSSVTFQEIFRYPEKEEWLRLSPRVITIEEQVAAQTSAEEKDLRRRLDLQYSFGVPEPTALGQVFDELQNLSGINFFIDSSDGGGDPDIEVSIPQLDDLPLKSIINLILKQAGEDYGYIIKEGAIVIGPRESLDEPKYFRSYEISDLIRPKPDFSAPSIALDELAGKDTAGGSIIDIGGDDDVGGGGTIPTEELLKIIAKEIEDDPDSEEPEGVNILGGKLSARISLEKHLKLAKILDELRKSTGMMVTVESRFLDIQDNFLEEIGIDFGGTSSSLPNTIPDADGAGTALAPGFEFIDAQEQFNLLAASVGGLSNPLGSQVNPFNMSSTGGGAYQLNVLDAQRFQLEAILTAVAKTQQVRRLNSPRVTAFNTQTAHTLVVSQAAFIQDLEVNQTGVIPVINPVIGVLNTGSILELRPTISYDQKYVTLEIQPTLAEEIGRDVAVLSLSGNFTVVPVQLPILSVTKIKTTVSVPDGGTVLVGGLKREIANEMSIGIPVLRRLPILNLLFGRKGTSTLRSNLFVLINAHITIVHEEEAEIFGATGL